MIVVRNQKPPQRKLLIFRLKLNINILLKDMAPKAVVEEGAAAVEEQDLVVELIITVTRTMDNHTKTDLVLMVNPTLQSSKLTSLFILVNNLVKF